MTDVHQIFFFLDTKKQSVSKICRNKKGTGRIMTNRMKLDCIRTQNVGKIFDPLFLGLFLVYHVRSVFLSVLKKILALLRVGTGV